MMGFCFGGREVLCDCYVSVVMAGGLVGLRSTSLTAFVSHINLPAQS